MVISRLDGLSALHSYSERTDRIVRYTLITGFNQESIWNSVVARVAAIGFAVLGLFVVSVPACIDMVNIARNMRNEHHSSWSTIAKVECCYLKAMAFGWAQIALQFICPELILTNTFDFRQKIDESIADVMVNYIDNVDMLYSAAHVDKTLLPDGGARIHEFKSELSSVCMEDPQFGSLLLGCQRFLQRHYTQEEISLSNNHNRQRPLVLAAIQGNEQRVRQLISEGGDIASRAFGGEYVFEIIEKKLGQAFLHQLITPQVFQHTTISALLKKLLRENKIAAAQLILHAIEQLPQEQQPAWWKMPIEKAALFALAAQHDHKEIAGKCIENIAVNVPADAPNGKTVLRIAIEKGWNDFAERMMAMPLVLSQQTEGVSIYESIAGNFGREKALSLVDVKAKDFGTLVRYLASRGLRQDVESLLTRFMNDATLLTWQNRAIITDLYRAAIVLSNKEVREKLLPYVDLVNPKGLSETCWWKTAAPNEKTTVKEDIRDLDVTNYQQSLPLIAYLMTKKHALSKSLTTKLMQLAPEEKARWKNHEALFSSLFIAAAAAGKRELATALIPAVDVAFEEPDTNKTALMAAAKRGWDDMVIAFIGKGAALHSLDNNEVTAFDYIARGCKKEALERIARSVTRDHFFAKNRQGNSLLSLMAAKNMLCGFFAPQIKEVLSPLGIPEVLLQGKASVSAIKEYISKRSYLSDTSIALDKKEAAIALLYADAIKVRNMHFLPLKTNGKHMQHLYVRHFGEIAPLPNNFDIDGCVNDVLRFVDGLWAYNEPLYDDGSNRTKVEVMEKIRSFLSSEHHDDPNGDLKKLYGHVFLAIRERINNRSALSQEKQKVVDRESKQFIQSVGATFFHCSDRHVADGRRYYSQFVENKKRTVEEEEQTAIEEIVHEELLQLRRSLFHEVYLSIDTNSHDVATQRYVENECNVEFGLHLPELSDVQNYSSLALRGKVSLLRERFQAAYNPCRIAQHLRTVINGALATQASGHAAPSARWYMKIQAFLENKHPGQDWNEIFDIETNSITTKGLEMLVTDLEIVR